MSALRIYKDDLQIAKSLINRDERATRRYFYQQYYPLFKSIYDNFYTDCKCCKEFIDEIYLTVMTPGKKTGKCQLENYRGESTLASWLKTVSLTYCYNKFKLKPPVSDPLPRESEKKDGDDEPISDRKKDESLSNPIDFSGMNRSDVKALLSLMPNKRYSRLIELRYLEQLSNEDTANELGMSMANYYNSHLRAKAQYDSVCRKEERNG